MTNLMLQPTGDPDDYEVTADGQTVGRIVLLAGAWSWAIDSAFRPGRHPAYGFEPTRDAAMQAFARSWFINEGHFLSTGYQNGRVREAASLWVTSAERPGQARAPRWGRPDAQVVERADSSGMPCKPRF